MKETLRNFCRLLAEYNLEVGESQNQLIEEFLSEYDVIDPYTEMVEEFHKRFKAPILNHPNLPNKLRCDLRIKLIQEELNELKEAIKNDDLVEVADALADIQYVLSGTYLEFGFQKKMYELVKEVHRSNMSKACKDKAEAVQTIKYYKKQRDTEAYYEEQDDGTYLVFRSGDDKVLKNIYYSEANLKTII